MTTSDQNMTFSQKFIPTTRKTAKTNLESFATWDLLVLLSSDWMKMLHGEHISDLALVMPRSRASARCQKGDQFAYLIFPSNAGEINSRIRYNKLLANLSACFRKIEYDLFLQRTMYQQARGNQFSSVWESLANDPQRPVSDSILHPAPYGSLIDNEDTAVIPPCTGREKLDLFKQNIGPLRISAVIKTHLNPPIKHVQLGNNFVGRSGAEAIRSYLLGGKSTVLTWYLGGNELDASSLSLICEGLHQDTQCKALWLKRNPLTDSASQAMCRLLYENNTIELLDLQNTAINDKFVEGLMKSLESNTGLKTLYLDGNALGINSAFAIASYFNSLVDSAKRGLTRIWLSMNRLRDQGVKVILHALKDYIHLEGLSLGSNGRSSVIAQEVFINLKDHPNLMFLDLGMYKATAALGELTNRIGDQGVAWIANLIAENKNLRVLSVSCNGISNEGLELLFETGVRHSLSLVHLDYNQYGLKIRKGLRDAIDQHLEENWRRFVISQNLPQSSRRSFIRDTKHTHYVNFIDTVFR